MVLAITGLKRSGKNTIASYISKQYRFVEYAFASPIKKASYEIFGWNPDDDEKKKEEIDPAWGISRRQFWQWFGTECMQFDLPDAFPALKEKIGRNIWVEAFRNLYEKDKNIDYIITDFRFPHENNYLTSIGAITIKIENNRIQDTDLHESEKYVTSLKTDFVISNNETLDELYESTNKLMKAIFILNGTRERKDV